MTIQLCQPLIGDPKVSLNPSDQPLMLQLVNGVEHLCCHALLIWIAEKFTPIFSAAKLKNLEFSKASARVCDRRI